MGLHDKLIRRKELDTRSVNRMYKLMTDNYDRVNRTLFEKDLGAKDLVLLLLDEQEVIQGFTTLGINPSGDGVPDIPGTSGNYHILFSGDTVVAPQHWGSQTLMKAWCYTVGRIMGAHRDKPWYWYLMSKGHRTYMYLPLFCKTYYPSLQACDEETALKGIADRVSSGLFPGSWRPEEGIIRFNSSLGELKPELAGKTWEKKHHPHVAYFLTRNPGFYKGEELVCIAPLRPDNLLRAAKNQVEKGMREPLP